MRKTIHFVGWALLCVGAVACVSDNPSVSTPVLDSGSIDEQLGREREQKQTAQEEERRAEKEYARLEKRVDTMGVCVLKDKYCENLTTKESCESDGAKGLCEWGNVFDQASITGCVPAMEYGTGTGQIHCARILAEKKKVVNDRYACANSIVFEQAKNAAARQKTYGETLPEVPAAGSLEHDYVPLCYNDGGTCASNINFVEYCKDEFDRIKADKSHENMCEHYSFIHPFSYQSLSPYDDRNLMGRSVCKTQSDRWKCRRKQNVPNPCPNMEKSACDKSSVCRWQKVKEQDER